MACSGTRAQTMYVREKTEVQTAYSLAGIQKLTFTPGLLSVMKTGGDSDMYQPEALRYLNFSDIHIGLDDPPAGDSRTSFRIFPNPARESFNIVATGSETLCGLIELINIDGCVVKSLPANSGREMEVDVRDLAIGTFFCRFSDGRMVQVLKFVKQ